MTTTYSLKRSLLILILTTLILWISSAVLVPLQGNLNDGIRQFIKGLYNLVCHQLPDRSFHVDSTAIYLCIRCSAFYLSGIVLAAFLLTRKTVRMLPLSFYVLLIFPALLDFILEKTGMYHDIAVVRFLTGILLGVAFFHLLILSLSKREDEFNMYPGGRSWITNA